MSRVLNGNKTEITVDGESISFYVVDNTIVNAKVGKGNHSPESRAKLCNELPDIFEAKGWTVGIPYIKVTNDRTGEVVSVEDNAKYEQQMLTLGLVKGSVKGGKDKYYSLYNLPNDLTVDTLHIPYGAKIPENLTASCLYLNDKMEVLDAKGLNIKCGIEITETLKAISPNISANRLISGRGEPGNTAKEYNVSEEKIPFVGNKFLFGLSNAYIAKLRLNYDNLSKGKAITQQAILNKKGHSM